MPQSRAIARTVRLDRSNALIAASSHKRVERLVVEDADADRHLSSSVPEIYKQRVSCIL
jgi:hypothetical protein